MWALGSLWAVRQWGIGKSKSGRYAYDTRTRGEWCHDCARASTRNCQRGPTHAAQCFYGRAKSRALGAHKPPPRAGPTMVVARHSHGARSTGQCSNSAPRGATKRDRSPHTGDRPVPTRQRQRERPCSGSFSLKHTESLFPEVRGHLITVHVHVQIGRKT